MQPKEITKTCVAKIRNIINNTPERTLVIFAMLVSVVFWSSISGYLKIQRYYADEWIYLQTAYAIKNGHGFNIYGFKGLGVVYERYVYSLVIAPACFIENMEIRFKVIAIINALSLSSAAIPVYLLSKEMLEERKKRLIAVIIALTMPYMNYCACFMAENILIPIELWLIYLNYNLIQFKNYIFKENVKRFVGIVFLLVLSWYTKDVGRVFLYMEGMTIILALINGNIEFIRKNPFRCIGIMVCLGLATIILMLYVISYSGNIGFLIETKSLLVKYTANLSLMNPIYLDCFLHEFISFILALCVIPIFYFVFNIKYLNINDKLFSIWLWALTIVLMAGVARVSFGRYHSSWGEFYEGFSQVHFRYIGCVFLPMLILFFRTTELKKKDENKELKLLFVLLLLFWANVVFFYKGAQLEHAPSYTTLYWVRNHGNVHLSKMYFSLIIAVIIFLFIYIYANCYKKIFILFIIIWTPIQMYNNVESHKSFTNENKLEEYSILGLREFVLNHENDCFLLIDMDDIKGEAPCLWRGDAYLDTKNIIRYGPTLLFRAEFPCDLNKFYNEQAPEVDYSHVKYIIIKSELVPADEQSASKINSVDSHWYTIYELHDMGVLPTIKKVGE